MKKKLPFDFLLDYLPSAVVIRPAIGMFYIYLWGKIVLIFRQVSKNPHHNGLWIATQRADQASLKADIPALTDFVFEEGDLVESDWLQLWEGHDDFEAAAIAVCGLISRRDKRIGKVTVKAVELTRP